LMRYIPLKNRPEIKEELRRIGNRRNVAKRLRLLAVADIKRQLDRIDQVLFKNRPKAAPKRRPAAGPAPKRQQPPKSDP